MSSISIALFVRYLAVVDGGGYADGIAVDFADRAKRSGSQTNRPRPDRWAAASLVAAPPTLQFSRQSVDRAQITEGLLRLSAGAHGAVNIGLWYVDRFMMKWLVNDYAVIGIYSIGFALASYIDQLLSTALSQALTRNNSGLCHRGADAVRVVKRRVLKASYLYLCSNRNRGHSGWARLLTLLASSSKAAATPVFIVMGLFFFDQDRRLDLRRWPAASEKIQNCLRSDCWRSNFQYRSRTSS